MENELYDVIVAGGGPAGCAAAIASARMKASTLLIERYGFLGGMGTAGLVIPFMQYGTARIAPPYLEYNPGKLLIKGIFQEIVENLKEEGGFGGEGYPNSFDPEVLKYVLDNMVEKSGVQLLLHTYVTNAICENNEIKELFAVSKSGSHRFKGKIFIDCTGDGDVAAVCGAEYEQGCVEDGLCQPATLMFIMGGLKLDKGYVEYQVPEEFELPQGRVLLFRMPRRNEAIINMTRIINFDGTSVHDLSYGEMQSRRQIRHIIDYLRKHVKGFEKAYLIQSAPQIGVRETRRIMGKYVLSAEDILNCSKFEDAVARSAYPIDIHNPSGKGFITKSIREGDWYEIPYRCLIPKKINNLLVAGRCVSATHEAQAAIRIQPTCYAMGQGAGIGAAIAAHAGIKPAEIDSNILYKAFREHNIL